jgi:general secretion pathway protein G
VRLFSCAGRTHGGFEVFIDISLMKMVTFSPPTENDVIDRRFPSVRHASPESASFTCRLRHDGPRPQDTRRDLKKRANDVKPNYLKSIKRRGQQGFTLLELLVVLLIIALLAGYVGPKLFSQVDKAKVKSTEAQMKTLGDAVTQYRLDTGRYPGADEGLDALVAQPQGADGWNGPYLAKAVPKDGWGRAYQWNVPGRDGEAEIVSLGRDGRVGGSGIDADLVYGM